MLHKEFFELYDTTYEVQSEINSINANVNYVQNMLGDNNILVDIFLPSDVDALRDICYIKLEKSTTELAKDLYKSLMDMCIKFNNSYPNINDDTFIDELTILLNSPYKTF